METESVLSLRMAVSVESLLTAFLNVSGVLLKA